MTNAIRVRILRANSLFLFAGSIGGLFADISGIYFARGPLSRIVAAAPYAGAGFIEAHGLAFIIAFLLWRAPSERLWHGSAMAVELLLGINNLISWQIFVAGDMLAEGYITISLHLLFAACQFAALASSAGQPRALSGTQG
jgi:hypothetical protein